MSNFWREELEKRAVSMPEAVQLAVKGILARSSDRRYVNQGVRALEAASKKEREAFWAIIFPAVKDEVEIAWNELSMQTVGRRDGGIEGTGARFSWPTKKIEETAYRFTWLRKLLIMCGPNPGLKLPELLIKAVDYAGGRWDSESGHIFDVDAPAYLAIPILNRGGPLAEECLTVLSQSLDGSHPKGRFGRHVMTALLCSDRPEAWALVDDQLANAGIDEGFRQRLLQHRHGIHPGAWRHMLHTVAEHGLWRFATVKDFLQHWLGIAWRWEAKPGIEAWVRLWAELHDNASLRDEKLQSGSPPERFLALHALAKEDGPAAVREAERIISESDPDRRLACAFFLSLCPPEENTACLARFVLDSDVRLVVLATRALGERLHRPSLPVGFSLHMELLLKEGFTNIPAFPAPFPDVKVDREEITELMVDSLKDGEEERMLPWLGNLSERARHVLIKKCNRLSPTPAQRSILLKFMRDSNIKVAEHAIEAARSPALSTDEIKDVESMLALKHAKRRLLLLDLLMRQPEATVLASAQRLAEASRLEQRLAGLELLRRLSSNEAHRAQVAKLVRQIGTREGLSQDEQRQIQELSTILGQAGEDVQPSSANAFGLVDPAKLPSYPYPQDRGVILHSPNTVALLLEMDALLTKHREVEFTTLDYGGQPKQTSIAQDGVPSCDRRLYDPEKDLARFPLVHIWEEWWKARPTERRDADGHELERMSVLLSAAASTPTKALTILYGISELPKYANKPYHLENILSWLRGAYRGPDWRSYILDAAETAVHLMRHESEMWPAHRWLDYAHRHVISRLAGATDIKAEHVKRYWQLVRRPLKRIAVPLYLWDVLLGFTLKVVSENELVWYLLSGKDFSSHSADRQFTEFGQTMSSHYIRQCVELRDPRVRAVIDQCRDRVVDVELKRGEAASDSSYAAGRVSNLRGVSRFMQLLEALGSGDLRRSQRSDDYSRSAVFTHLICVCRPADDDTAETFALASKQTRVAPERLIEISVLAPQWAAFIGNAIGAPKLREAVDWIHAHTKTSEWSWQAKTREMWAGELSRLTPVPADELLEGAVDEEWFQRAYHAVGAKLWSQLYDAAKFACGGTGHSRARLFADALLGKVSATELAGLVKTKGHQDAVRSIGLVPLPIDNKKRKAELLRRYRVLAEFRHGGAKSKAQKRASEETACRIGMSNLARAAGYADPERFGWAMETEEASDLKSQLQEAVIGDITVKLEVTPFGKIELQANRAGKPLKSLPSAVKKHPSLAPLIERRESARDQVARMRPALEDMMVRGVALDAAQWRDLLRHPLLAPMLERLVLTNLEETAGFPLRDGTGFLDAEGNTLVWPPDNAPLRIAHPSDLLPASRWHQWQRVCFERGIVQPFKQVFRELYVVVDKEKGTHGESRRYEGHAVKPHQALAILGKRGWVHHPEEGLHRVYHAANCVAWLSFEEYFYHPGELQQVTVSAVRFTDKAGKTIPIENIAPRIFSEAMRDVDLVVSVAHITGTVPEASRSSVEMREALIRETCRLLDLTNVRIEPPTVHIQGSRGSYRVHLSSGIVHLRPGRMLFLQPVASRDRLFLPFADDDPKAVEVLSKVLLLAEDKLIKDPGFIMQLDV